MNSARAALLVQPVGVDEAWAVVVGGGQDGAEEGPRAGAFPRPVDATLGRRGGPVLSISIDVIVALEKNVGCRTGGVCRWK
jgi:hypothetical protein